MFLRTTITFLYQASWTIRPAPPSDAPHNYGLLFARQHLFIETREPPSGPKSPPGFASGVPQQKQSHVIYPPAVALSTRKRETNRTNDCGGVLLEDSPSPASPRLTIRRTGGPAGDRRANSAIRPAAVRTSSLEFQVAAVRWNLTANHSTLPYTVFLAHIGKGVFRLTPRTTQLGMIAVIPPAGAGQSAGNRCALISAVVCSQLSAKSANSYPLTMPSSL